MKKSNKRELRLDFRSLSFAELIEQDESLAELRRTYRTRTAKERRTAADWAYNESFANELFGRAVALAGEDTGYSQRWPSGIESLAIDPTYAPAMLSVGSMEYQLGRKDEAVRLFLALLKLPKNTEDLETIIDKAGSFLIEAKDFESASTFYEAACSVFPESGLLMGGRSYCLAKLGRFDDAVTIQRQAVALEPGNPELLSDLGWSLIESGRYAEAEEVLREAVALSPPDYGRARHNLEELHRRMRP